MLNLQYKEARDVTRTAGNRQQQQLQQALNQTSEALQNAESLQRRLQNQQQGQQGPGDTEREHDAGVAPGA